MLAAVIEMGLPLLYMLLAMPGALPHPLDMPGVPEPPVPVDDAAAAARPAPPVGPPPPRPAAPGAPPRLRRSPRSWPPLPPGEPAAPAAPVVPPRPGPPPLAPAFPEPPPAPAALPPLPDGAPAWPLPPAPHRRGPLERSCPRVRARRCRRRRPRFLTRLPCRRYLRRSRILPATRARADRSRQTATSSAKSRTTADSKYAP